MTPVTVSSRTVPLFVCHAHCCRSVLASFLYRQLCRATVLSAGLSRGSEPATGRLACWCWGIDAAGISRQGESPAVRPGGRHLCDGSSVSAPSLIEYGEDLAGKAYLYARTSRGRSPRGRANKGLILHSMILLASSGSRSSPGCGAFVKSREACTQVVVRYRSGRRYPHLDASVGRPLVTDEPRSRLPHLRLSVTATAAAAGAQVCPLRRACVPLAYAPSVDGRPPWPAQYGTPQALAGLRDRSSNACRSQGLIGPLDKDSGTPPPPNRRKSDLRTSPGTRPPGRGNRREWPLLPTSAVRATAFVSIARRSPTDHTPLNVWRSGQGNRVQPCTTVPVRARTADRKAA